MMRRAKQHKRIAAIHNIISNGICSMNMLVKWSAAAHYGCACDAYFVQRKIHIERNREAPIIQYFHRYNNIIFVQIVWKRRWFWPMQCWCYSIASHRIASPRMNYKWKNYWWWWFIHTLHIAFYAHIPVYYLCGRNCILVISPCCSGEWVSESEWVGKKKKLSIIRFQFIFHLCLPLKC